MSSQSFFSAPPPLPSLHGHRRRSRRSIHSQSTTISFAVKASLPIFSPSLPLSHSFSSSRTGRISSFASIRAASESVTVVLDDSAVASSSSATASVASLYPQEEDKAAEAESKIGARVRVKLPLKVYHIPKVPEFELNGLIGVLKQYVAVWKGKLISANLPYKVEFVAKIEGRDGPVKFFAHLREDEFEYIG